MMKPAPITITAPPQLQSAPSPDERIIVAGCVIIVFGIVEATQEGKQLTPVLEGGIVVMLLASLASAIYPKWGDLMAALVMLAAGAVALTELPTILQGVSVALSAVAPIGGDKAKPPTIAPPIEPGISSTTTSTQTNYTGGGIVLE